MNAKKKSAQTEPLDFEAVRERDMAADRARAKELGPLSAAELAEIDARKSPFTVGRVELHRLCASVVAAREAADAASSLMLRAHNEACVAGRAHSDLFSCLNATLIGLDGLREALDNVQQIAAEGASAGVIASEIAAACGHLESIRDAIEAKTSETVAAIQTGGADA